MGLGVEPYDVRYLSAELKELVSRDDLCHLQSLVFRYAERFGSSLRAHDNVDDLVRTDLREPNDQLLHEIGPAD